MRKLKPARVVIELDGVRATLIGRGGNETSTDFWICKDRDMKEYLDASTSLLMFEGKLEYPPAILGHDWALIAGKATAEDVGAKIILSEPSEYYGPPDDRPAPPKSSDWF